VRHGAKRLLAAIALSCACSSGLAERSLAVRVPDTAQVTFRGMLDRDGLGGGAGGMMYPAPDAVTALAALIAHGLIVGATRSAEAQAAQNKADEVLAPFAPVLAGFAPLQLIERGLARMKAGSGRRIVQAAEAREGEWVVETLPVFSMTQDRRGLVLDNAIVIHAGDVKRPVYRNFVRVVGAPLPDGTDAEAAWKEAAGRKLLEESAGLWGESVDIAFAHAVQAPAEVPARTVRYRQGGHEKFERAEILHERCERLLLRTLRGELMSVPAMVQRQGC
jgi:hypothetical protein